MSLRRLIHHNFWLKLFSLLLATMLWFAVFSVQDRPERVPGYATGIQQKTFEKVAISILKTPSDTRLYTVSPSSVDVKVEGAPEAIAALTIRDFEVFINLANRRYENTLPQVHALVQGDVRVLDISPGFVRVKRFSP
jgi:YbbR domain-containing protein